MAGNARARVHTQRALLLRRTLLPTVKLCVLQHIYVTLNVRKSKNASVRLAFSAARVAAQWSHA
jgi:hypothetical protein